MPKAEFEPAPAGSGSGPRYAEVFDIYLMSFAGDGRAVAAELARAFLIEAATARKMVEEAPLVVKRGVAPDVAAQYLDVLTRLGAQVVLLPSTQPSEPSPAEVALPKPSEPPPGIVTPLAPMPEPMAPLVVAELRPLAPLAATHATEPIPAVAAPDSSAPRAPARALPRLGTPTVFESPSPFDSIPAPVPSWVVQADAKTPAAANWDVFGAGSDRGERRDAAADEEDVLDLGRAFTPVPPPAEADGSWLNPVPAPAERDPGSGLFMAASADDFVAANPRITQTAPLPVIKPLRERPASTRPPSRPSVLPAPLPSVRPSPPPPVRAFASSVRPPPKAGFFPAASIPPPVPPTATVVAMSRRPPPVIEAPAEATVLELDLAKVPPLPMLSIAPRALDVDPGDLTSLPRIELDPVRKPSRSTPSPPTGDETAKRTRAQDAAAQELASLPPMEAIRAPVPAPVRVLVATPPALKAAKAPPSPAVAPPAIPVRPPVPSAAGASTPSSGARLAALKGKMPRLELSDTARRGLVAAGLFGCAAVIIGFGVRLDDSVLYGNASIPAVLLHAFAFYAVGAGILGMLRS